MFSYSNTELAVGIGLFILLTFVPIFIFRKKIDQFDKEKLRPFIKWLLPPYQIKNPRDFLQNKRGYALVIAFALGGGCYSLLLYILGTDFLCGKAVCYSEIEFKGAFTRYNEIEKFLTGILSSAPFSWCCLIDKIIGYPAFAAAGAVPALALNWYWRTTDAKKRLDNASSQEEREKEKAKQGQIEFEDKRRNEKIEFEQKQMREAIQLITQPPTEAERLSGYQRACRLLIGLNDELFVNEKFSDSRHLDFFIELYAFYSQLINEGDNEALVRDDIKVEVICRMATLSYVVELMDSGTTGSEIPPTPLLDLSYFLSLLVRRSPDLEDPGFPEHLKIRIDKQSHFYSTLLKTGKTSLLDAFVCRAIGRLYVDYSIKLTPFGAKDLGDSTIDALSDTAISVGLDVMLYRATLQAIHDRAEDHEGRVMDGARENQETTTSNTLVNEAVEEISGLGSTGTVHKRHVSAVEARTTFADQTSLDLLKKNFGDSRFYGEEAYSRVFNPKTFKDFAKQDGLLGFTYNPNQFITKLYGKHRELAEGEHANLEEIALGWELGTYVSALNTFGYGHDKTIEEREKYKASISGAPELLEYFTNGAFGILGNPPAQFRSVSPVTFFTICALRTRIMDCLHTALTWLSYIVIKSDTDHMYAQINPDQNDEWWKAIDVCTSWVSANSLLDELFLDRGTAWIDMPNFASEWISKDGELGPKGSKAHKDPDNRLIAAGEDAFLRMLADIGFLNLFYDFDLPSNLANRMHLVLIKLERELDKMIEKGHSLNAPWARKWAKKDDSFKPGRHVAALAAKGVNLDPSDTDGAPLTSDIIALAKAAKLDQEEKDEHDKKVSKEAREFEKSQRTPEQVEADEKRDARLEPQRKIRDSVTKSKDPKGDN